jgi:hypothetical protein
VKPNGQLVVALAVALSGCSGSKPQGSTQAPSDVHFFIPANAQGVKYGGRPEIPEVSYSVETPYPASQFLCDLTTNLDHDHWRALREDPLNPGRASSIVEGWGDFINGLKKPQTHEHSWLTSWVDDKGELLLYALRYDYPEGAKPDFRLLEVSAVRWPADAARALTGRSAAQLSALTVSPPDPGCAVPVPWSEFVRGQTRESEPAYVPYELKGISAIDIANDIDGLAGRIAQAIQQKHPALKVVTPAALPSPTVNDAVLTFAFACRCRQRGAPDGFYVTEAVVYKPSVTGLGWNDPARVLFYWSDHGDPAWKHVPAGCFSERTRSQSCATAFLNADISFTNAIVAALGDAKARR